MQRQVSVERGGGGGGGVNGSGLRRYGTSSSMPPSPPLGHLDSGLSEAAPGGVSAAAATANFVRLPYIRSTLLATHEQHVQVEPEPDRPSYDRYLRQCLDTGLTASGGGDTTGAGGYPCDYGVANGDGDGGGAGAAGAAGLNLAGPDADGPAGMRLREQLESYLQLILDNPYRDLLAVRERVANAVNVFGMEELVMRLFPIVGRPDAAGGGSGTAGASFRQYAQLARTPSRRGVFRGGRRLASSSGTGAGPGGGGGGGSGSHHQVGAKADFHRMIGDEYNAKWRLLSAFIDANCRYLMPAMYAVCFLLIMWAKVWANDELEEGPSPERSAQGLQVQ